MKLVQLRQWIGDVAYRLRPHDFHTHERRWFWQQPITAVQVLDSLTPDQRMALGYALLQHLRRYEEEQR